MVKFRIFVFLFIIFAQSLSAWELSKEKNDIRVYTRLTDISLFKEFKGITKIKAPVSVLVSLISDPSSYQDWMHNCIGAKLLKQVDSTSRYSHVRNKSPWPAKNRDLIVFSEMSKDKSTGEVTIRLKGVPDFIPELEGFVRVPKMNGMWKFKPLGDSETEAVYQVLADPGGGLPVVLVNSASIDLPYNTLLNLRERFKNGKTEKNNQQ